MCVYESSTVIKPAIPLVNNKHFILQKQVMRLGHVHLLLSTTDWITSQAQFFK